VLEDDASHLDIACGCLRKLGVSRIMSCMDGHQALMMLRTYHPDILICGWHLNGLMASAFCAWLQSKATQAPSFY
jgi:CheY-like chemotaxis protein